MRITRIEQRTLRAIQENGLRVEPVGTAGAIRVVGPGVDIVADSLATLNPRDLTPYRPMEDEDPRALG